jgi:hypothetical protein
MSIHAVAIRPKRVPPSWRQGRIEARLSDVGSNNQASYRMLPETHPGKDRRNFHTDGELRMYEALVRAQQRRPPEATIGILPGAGFRAAERTFWPDLVVTHRGRVGIIEVDGPKHRNWAAADQSRDRRLQDAGVVLTDRIMVEDADELLAKAFDWVRLMPAARWSSPSDRASAPAQIAAWRWLVHSATTRGSRTTTAVARGRRAA